MKEKEMLVVQDCIVSESVADCCFSCPLQQCQGACCVEGDAGAPLEEEEIALLERVLPEVKKYMEPEGIAAVEQQGVAVRDVEGDWGTPLVHNRECAFVVREGDTALCAIEKAFRDGKIDYMKPISCHLYPIRVEHYGQFTAVNYHEWDICRCAVSEGRRQGIPIYRYLKTPLIRKFGEDWYEELVKQCDEYIQKHGLQR